MMGNQVDSTTSKQENSPMKVDTYVSIGASDTVGIGTTNPSKDGWVPTFASLISAERTINLGRSGSTLNDAITQQLPKVFDKKPNVITIWLVVNDFNRQVYDRSILNSYTTDLNLMLSQLRNKLDKNTRILVGNIPDLSKVSIYTSLGIPKLLLTIQIKRWNDQIKEIVKKHQCDLVDLYSHWKELGDHPEYISFDGFHPSKDGYQRLAQIFHQHFIA
jgi:lysophospholipase L1-like esterase